MQQKLTGDLYEPTTSFTTSFMGTTNSWKRSKFHWNFCNWKQQPHFNRRWIRYSRNCHRDYIHYHLWINFTIKHSCISSTKNCTKTSNIYQYNTTMVPHLFQQTNSYLYPNYNNYWSNNQTVNNRCLRCIINR